VGCSPVKFLLGVPSFWEGSSREGKYKIPKLSKSAASGNTGNGKLAGRLRVTHKKEQGMHLKIEMRSKKEKGVFARIGRT